MMSQIITWTLEGTKYLKESLQQLIHILMLAVVYVWHLAETIFLPLIEWVFNFILSLIPDSWSSYFPGMISAIQTYNGVGWFEYINWLFPIKEITVIYASYYTFKLAVIVLRAIIARIP